MSDDKSVWPEFYLGGPQQDIEKVRIKIAGDNKTEINRKVGDQDRQRWPDAYQRFKEGVVDKAAGGTPLKDWPRMTIDRINQLNQMNIYTVEQYRDVSDGNLVHLGMGARDERDAATAFLADDRPSYDALMKRIDDLEAQLAEKRKPGRPRKDEAVAA